MAGRRDKWLRSTGPFSSISRMSSCLVHRPLDSSRIRRTMSLNGKVALQTKKLNMCNISSSATGVPIAVVKSKMTAQLKNEIDRKEVPAKDEKGAHKERNSLHVCLVMSQRICDVCHTRQTVNLFKEPENIGHSQAERTGCERVCVPRGQGTQSRNIEKVGIFLGVSCLLRKNPAPGNFLKEMVTKAGLSVSFKKFPA